METLTIREQLHEYIDNSDGKLLKLMLALAKEYHDEVDFEPEFSEEEIAELDILRAKRLSGESKTYSWEEAKKMITGKG